MKYQHETLAAGRWYTFSLFEQMGNIGSEISRAIRWREKDHKLYEGAIDRALELLDLTIQDPRWNKRLKELTRTRELLCDAIFGGRDYGSTLEWLDHYLLQFACAARLHKYK